MTQKQTYDSKCYELAEHFLKDVPPDEHSRGRGGFTAHEQACHDLAMTIQHAVEEWFVTPPPSTTRPDKAYGGGDPGGSTIGE